MGLGAGLGPRDPGSPCRPTGPPPTPLLLWVEPGAGPGVGPREGGLLRAGAPGGLVRGAGS